MNQYQTTVQQLLSYLAEHNQCRSSRLSHQKCYEELGQYLETNKIELSEDTASQWILSIQGKYNRQRCCFWRQYVKQLIIFYHTGSIPDELFYQIQSSYDKVPVSMKSDLDLYLESCHSRYTDRSFELARIYCSRVIFYLWEQGITCIQEISFLSVDALIHTDFNCSKDTREVYLMHRWASSCQGQRLPTGSSIVEYSCLWKP